MAAFLAKASIVREKTTSDGMTRPIRATLSDGVLTHDAQFQTVDQASPVFNAGKASEVDFKDTYRFNIAGYRLAQLVGLETVPMSVERNYKGKSAAVTWWIDDVMFDEGGRQKLQDKLGPEPERTQKQIYIMYVWDELIQNKDRNGGNIVWTKDWTMWLIDHTRAFRSGGSLLKPERLLRIERTLFARMKELTEQSVSQADEGEPDPRRDRGGDEAARCARPPLRKADRRARRGRGVLYFVASGGAVIVMRRPSS